MENYFNHITHHADIITNSTGSKDIVMTKLIKVFKPTCSFDEYIHK
jgi:hypothetical protein